MTLWQGASGLPRPDFRQNQRGAARRVECETADSNVDLRVSSLEGTEPPTFLAACE
ncbi:hypothetical protein ACRAWG_11180 [Methylobacterium sp. P31]